MQLRPLAAVSAMVTVILCSGQLLGAELTESLQESGSWAFSSPAGVEFDASINQYHLSADNVEITGEWVFPGDSVVAEFRVLPAVGDSPYFSFGPVDFTYGDDGNGEVVLYYRDEADADWLPTGIFARDEIGWRTIEVRVLANEPTQLILDNSVVFEIQESQASPILHLFLVGPSEAYLSEPNLFGPPPSVETIPTQDGESVEQAPPQYRVTKEGVEIDYEMLRSKLAEKGIILPAGVLDPRELPGSNFVKVLEENAPPTRGVAGKPSNLGFDVSEEK